MDFRSKPKAYNFAVRRSLLRGNVGHCIPYESHINISGKNYWNKYAFGHIKVVREF